MLPKPQADLKPMTVAYEVTPLVRETGFREYDARWLFGPDINLVGVQALGLGLGTYYAELGKRRVAVGHDFRSYSLSIKQALMLGLVGAGCDVLDIGLSTTPMSYFAQFDIDAPCLGMVTASHNENGWTGVKMGADPPLTFGPDEMGRLKEIVLSGAWTERPGGVVTRVDGVAERYIADAAAHCTLKRKLKVVCACGNGTAGAFAPGCRGARSLASIRPILSAKISSPVSSTTPQRSPSPSKPRARSAPCCFTASAMACSICASSGLGL